MMAPILGLGGGHGWVTPWIRQCPVGCVLRATLLIDVRTLLSFQKCNCGLSLLSMRSKLKKNGLNYAKKWDKSAWLAKSLHKDTSSAIFVSPICDLKIASCKAGLHSISWQAEEDINEEEKSR